MLGSYIILWSYIVLWSYTMLGSYIMLLVLQQTPATVFLVAGGGSSAFLHNALRAHEPQGRGKPENPTKKKPSIGPSGENYVAGSGPSSPTFPAWEGFPVGRLSSGESHPCPPPPPPPPSPKRRAPRSSSGVQQPAVFRPARP